MNKYENYLRQLEWELRDLSAEERADVIAEIDSHIDAGLKGDTAVSEAQLIQDLGSPTELAQNLRRANWKRDLVNVSLIWIPALVSNFINASILSLSGFTPQTYAVTFIIGILLYFTMFFVGVRRGARILQGWWLASAMSAVFSTYIFMLTQPLSWTIDLIWKIVVLGMLVSIGLIYGRFLWKNRIDGLVVTISLIPFLWGGVFIVGINEVLSGVAADERRIMWGAQLGTIAMVLIVIIGFLVSNRLLQWGLLTLTCVAYTFTLIAFWLPNPNALVWLLLLTPLLLGFSSEMLSYRNFKQELIYAE